MTKAISSCG